MTDTLVVMLSFTVTLLLSVALTPAVRPLLVKLGIVDVPNARSSHERPVLRGLGLAVFIAMLAGYVVGILLETTSPTDAELIVTITLVAGASALLGLFEDIRGVSVIWRSIMLLAIAVFAGARLVSSGFVSASVLLGVGATEAALSLPAWFDWVLLAYAVLFLSSFINVSNFMDGLNGISGFHGVIAGLTFAAIGHVTEFTWLGIAGVVLAAGYLGFLPYNLFGRGAFLGDVGSYLLGGATAVTSLAALMHGVPLLATIGPLVIYFGDVGVTLVRRVKAGHRWDEPHKEHVYQRIQQLGFSHVSASGITALCTATTSLLGFVSLFVGGVGQSVLLVSGLFVLAIYLSLPRLLERLIGSGSN